MEFNRLVAYIYSYNNGLKSRNTGFAKIEVRNDILKLLINMKGAYTDGLSEWEVCFFVRNERFIEPSVIGTMLLKGGMGEFKYTEDAMSLGDRAVSFKDVSGLFMRSSDMEGKIFASEWDDLGFDVERIGFAPVVELEAAELPESSEQLEPLEVPEDVTVPEELELVEPAPLMNIDMLYTGRDKLSLFADDDIYDVIEITPEDILQTPETNWGLKNNSFLNHGFYNFRHLILGKAYREGGCKYIIGVPGIYSRRDRQMAAMYGFVKFKFSMRSDMKLGQFGYWYKEIDC